MNRTANLLVAGLIISGCLGKGPGNSADTGISTEGSVTVKYAAGFCLGNNEEGRIITVKNPWQNANRVEFTYFLSDTFAVSEMLSDNSWRIKTPVDRVVCLSTTHIGFIDFLDELGSITGISGKDYVVNEVLRSRIEKELLPDVGYDENLNFELLISLKPDVVFAYGVSGTVTNTIKKLGELGIPVIMVAEYLEEEPLAKMEWVKLFAAFYKKEQETAHRFDSIAGAYEQLRMLARAKVDSSNVLLGLPWRGTWYISGSKSYIARLIDDAGGKYLWDHLDFKDSRPIELEKVFEYALGADFWINSGDARSKREIGLVDDRFERLPAFVEDKIYNNNNILSPSGGNAFFESGVVEPHIILADLIYILHPQLLPSHKLIYYRKLQ
jgi:iron complex transport system substrate-binding protein